MQRKWNQGLAKEQLAGTQFINSSKNGNDDTDDGWYIYIYTVLLPSQKHKKKKEKSNKRESDRDRESTDSGDEELIVWE